MVEHFSCKEDVTGSSPVPGSAPLTVSDGRYPLGDASDRRVPRRRPSGLSEDSDAQEADPLATGGHRRRCRVFRDRPAALRGCRPGVGQIPVVPGPEYTVRRRCRRLRMGCLPPGYRHSPFPDGLTLIDGYGQWRDAEGEIHGERSIVLVILVRPDDDAAGRIDEIFYEYEQRFKQESVLRVVDKACASFS